MPLAKTAPYGSWRSPISAEAIAAGAIRLSDIQLSGTDIYWIEMRPSEGGRNVIVRARADGSVSDVTPQGFNARTRVHEYGGGSYLVADGVVYFTNDTDQRIYHQREGSAPEPITAPGDWRFADGTNDTLRNRTIWVGEDHTTGDTEPRNCLVAVGGSADARPEVLVAGADFYSSPRVSPDGNKLAWLSWNHPDMPWDATELWVGRIADDGKVVEAALVAGGGDESICQPEWSADGTLYFVCDRTGWWNPYRIESGSVTQVISMEAEFARPHWVFGLSNYAFESEEKIICAFARKGIWQLAAIDTPKKSIDPLSLPYTDIAYLRARPGLCVFRGGSAGEPQSIVAVDTRSGQARCLKRSTAQELSPAYISQPESIEFPSEAGRAAHAFFYRPLNEDCAAPEHERPPLLVKSHGGPTSQTDSSLKLEIQYWTSRGIAVVDVNYGGSTGFGTSYRRSLNGRWGVVDVADCISAARYLCERGDVDANRLAISGGSAGGYTTLCALTFHDTFRAGASYYGVSDLVALAADTHKFESRYLEGLVGPYPEASDLYKNRSPINFTEKLRSPMIFFQGLEDRVVPPAQTELMVEALKAAGVAVAYIPFPGEQHGFRLAENIRRALESELYFYSRIFGFELAEPVAPVPIDNIEALGT